MKRDADIVVGRGVFVVVDVREAVDVGVLVVENVAVGVRESVAEDVDLHYGREIRRIRARKISKLSKIINVKTSHTHVCVCVDVALDVAERV